MKTDYEKQGQDFLEKTKTEFTVVWAMFGKHFPDDKENRDIYNITLKRNGKSYSFQFGQSVHDSQHYIDRLHKERISAKRAKALGFEARPVKGKIPTAYDVLSCLTKYEPGTFEDFCPEFGYDVDSIKAKGVYEAVRDEYLNLCKLYSPEELEQMAEIN